MTCGGLIPENRGFPVLALNLNLIGRFGTLGSTRRYTKDKHRNAVTLSAMERWEKGRFERTVKELSQFDNKKPDELESKFDNFYVDNSHPTSPFKGPNIVDLDFVYKQLLDGHKACKTTLSLT